VIALSAVVNSCRHHCATLISFLILNCFACRVQTSALPSVTDFVSVFEDEFEEKNGEGRLRGIPGEICVLLEFSSSSSSSSSSSCGTDIDSPESRLSTRYERHYLHYRIQSSVDLLMFSLCRTVNFIELI
jgi:hypothetical protein